MLLRATYIGGPTALFEVAGLRLLTDPTFDPGGTEYRTSVYTLRKIAGPALTTEGVGDIDAVLLSHDHHFDNLDRSGRAFLPLARCVLTTRAGAERLGGNAIGLEAWGSTEIQAHGGGALRVTATPARHGPPDGDRGPVIGFLLSEPSAARDSRPPAIYVSGDTVWYDDLVAVTDRADVRVAVLFLGAARVQEVGPAHLTMTASEAVTAARAFANAAIVPLHYAGWAHFSEGRAEVQRAFDDAHLSARLCWLEPGRATGIGTGNR